MNNDSKLPIAILAIIICLCIGIYICVIKPQKEDDHGGAEPATEELTDDSESEDTESFFSGEENEVLSDKDNYSHTDYGTTIPYTDNDYPDVGACLSPNDYEIYYAPGFSFGYPRYIFNDGYVDQEAGTYDLWYDKDYRLTINVYPAEGGAETSAHKIYQSKLQNYSSTYFKKDVRDLNRTEMARALVGGYYQSTGHSDYNIIASDGIKTYVLTMDYIDDNPKDDYKEINYVVDCIYRYCSFGGGTYKPRTWEQFLQDDMGEKK